MFRQRDGGQLEGEATGLEYPPFDVINPLFEMRVTRIYIRPGIDNGNDRFSVPVFLAVTHLHYPGAMAECTKIIGIKPAGASERFF